MRVYSSLGHVGVLAEAPDGLVLVQTDHRSRAEPAEIEAEPELSVCSH